MGLLGTLARGDLYYARITHWHDCPLSTPHAACSSTRKNSDNLYHDHYVWINPRPQGNMCCCSQLLEGSSDSTRRCGGLLSTTHRLCRIATLDQLMPLPAPYRNAEMRDRRAAERPQTPIKLHRPSCRGRPQVPSEKVSKPCPLTYERAETVSHGRRTPPETQSVPVHLETGPQTSCHLPFGTHQNHYTCRLKIGPESASYLEQGGGESKAPTEHGWMHHGHFQKHCPPGKVKTP